MPSTSRSKTWENLPGLAWYQAGKIEIDLTEFGEATWPNLVSSSQGKNSLGSEIWDSDCLDLSRWLSKLRDY